MDAVVNNSTVQCVCRKVTDALFRYSLYTKHLEVARKYGVYIYMDEITHAFTKIITD